MLSAPLSYQMITRDMSATLKRTAAQPDVKRASDYYRENIGKVTSLEEFFDDHRLYSYAMKAFGLEDMTYAKAFMRKVLESDLADSKSFANKLVDKRYQEFAKAFSFLKPSPQSPDALSDIKTRYAKKAAEQGDSESLIKFGTLAYEQSLPAVKTVDDFLADNSLVGYATTAFGVEPPGTGASAKLFLRRILTSDPNDADSFAARQTKSAWREFAAAFNFSADGTVRVQTSGQMESRRPRGAVHRTLCRCLGHRAAGRATGPLCRSRASRFRRWPGRERRARPEPRQPRRFCARGARCARSLHRPRADCRRAGAGLRRHRAGLPDVHRCRL